MRAEKRKILRKEGAVKNKGKVKTRTLKKSEGAAPAQFFRSLSHAGGSAQRPPP